MKQKTVIQPSYLEEKKIILDLDKEISTLLALGVEEYEIKYLVALKKKREASLKWKNT